MTREEARNRLLNYSRFIVEGTDLWEALDMAIEALKGDAESATITDCISRQAAIKALGEEPWIAHDTDEEWAEHDAWVMHRNAISSLPPVTPTEQQEHGRLIDADYLLQETFTVDEEEWTTPEIRAILENAPPVEPKPVCRAETRQGE